MLYMNLYGFRRVNAKYTAGRRIHPWMNSPLDNYKINTWYKYQIMREREREIEDQVTKVALIFYMENLSSSFPTKFAWIYYMLPDEDIQKNSEYIKSKTGEQFMRSCISKISAATRKTTPIGEYQTINRIRIIDASPITCTSFSDTYIFGGCCICTYIYFYTSISKIEW